MCKYSITVSLLILYIQGHQSAPSFLDTFESVTRNLGQSIGNGLSGVFTGASGLASSPLEAIGQAFNQTPVKLLGDIISGTGQTLGHTLNNTGTALNTSVVGSLDLLSNVLSNSGKVTDSVLGGLTGLVQNGTSSPLDNFTNKTFSSSADLITGASNDTGNLFKDVLSSLGKIVGDAVGDVGNIATNVVNNTGSILNASSLPSSASTPAPPAA
ncbi:uncharacterized protein LOC143910396 [Arctopsyche grandis]|uniref:uncharacterized protein LOC143910396 n=1 Tax=Arctopsyche grandis TaxID=121162 RepID=UPI00406D94F1